MLKDQVMEMQSKCGHLHHLLVSLRMLEVKPLVRKAPQTQAQPFCTPWETAKLRAMIYKRRCQFPSTSDPTAPPSAAGRLIFQSLHFLFHGHTANTNNSELFCTCILPNPGVFSEHLFPTHASGTLASPIGMPAETHGSYHHMPRAWFQLSKAQTEHPTENQHSFPSHP